MRPRRQLFRKKLWHVKRRQTCCSLTAFCVRKLFEETSILFRFLSRFLPEQFFSTADDNDDTKNHQQNGDDELQSFNEEDSGSCSIRFYSAMTRSTSAVKVTQSMMISGGNRVLFSRPVTFRKTQSVIRTSALSIWFALPNSGQILAYPIWVRM